MDKTALPRIWRSLFRLENLKSLFLYVLAPFFILWLLAEPIRSAVRFSDAAAFGILLAALAVTGLNWFVYSILHRKYPPLQVFAHGIFCMLIVVIIGHEALPNDYALTSTLAIIGSILTMVYLLLISDWLASRRTKPACSAAVVIRVILGMILCLMVYQIFRDVETRLVNRDTWIIILFLIAFLLAFNVRKIRSAVRRTASHRRATGLAAGRIVKIIGETHLDLDDDLVTLFHCVIQYTVDDVLYEMRADVTRRILRRYGKENFIGLEVPVFYDPGNPADAFTNRIDKHVFDLQAQQP